MLTSILLYLANPTVGTSVWEVGPSHALLPTTPADCLLTLHPCQTHRAIHRLTGNFFWCLLLLQTAMRVVAILQVMAVALTMCLISYRFLHG